MKKEIKGLAEIEEMVNGFYARVREDDLLGPIFSARIPDWEPHLSKMYSFWNQVLFHQPGYNGRPFPPHMEMPIEKAHFQRWVDLFNQNLDERFTGLVAEEARTRAVTIAAIFLTKITALRQPA